MPRKSSRIAAVLLPLALAGAGAGAGAGAAPAPAAAAAIDPANFVAHVDNPWFPLKPGSLYRYTGTKDGKSAVDVLTVTHRTKRIVGVPTVVIRDRLYLDGKLEETTTDWYTQDRRGNVWYFGERTAVLNAAGRVISREGSWRTGVDGARPGIFMPAHPKVGRTYAQEHYKGHAEDHFTIRDLSASVTVPFITTTHALRTTEQTPLEPGVLDAKFYVRGIGTIQERQLKGSGDERLDLVSMTRGG